MTYSKRNVAIWMYSFSIRVHERSDRRSLCGRTLVDMMNGRRLTDLQALDWREYWSFTDREFIEHALSVLPEHDLHEPASGGYIAATVNGRIALYVCPGYLWWPKGTWAGAVDGSLIPGGLLDGGEEDGTMWARLSTIRHAGRPKMGRSFDYGVCSECNIQLPATGVCDNH